MVTWAIGVPNLVSLLPARWGHIFLLIPGENNWFPVGPPTSGGLTGGKNPPVVLVFPPLWFRGVMKFFFN